MRFLATIPMCILSLHLGFASAASETPPPVQWIHQFGTQSIDRANAVTSDSQGGIYVTGHVKGTLSESPAGSHDVFLRKYDTSGAVQWTRQMGSSAGDIANSIASDGVGHLYVSGYTTGNLDDPNAPLSERDPFLLKYDIAGNLQWSRQFGTGDADLGFDVFADNQGNVFVSGSTEGALDGTNAGRYDAFLSKYDDSGEHLWTRQYGTTGSDWGEGVAADSAGNVYLAGGTEHFSGSRITGSDAFLVKYDSAGEYQWTRMIGAGDRIGATDLVVNGNKVHVVGNKLQGSGDWDSYLSSYNTEGELQSFFQWGISGSSLTYDLAYDVTLDPRGGLIVAGETRSDLGGVNQGGVDATVTKFDANGTLQWIHQLGTTRSDFNRGVTTDNVGNIYLSGTTFGSLDGDNAGNSDAYIYKLFVIPEPTTSALALAAFCLAIRRNR